MILYDQTLFRRSNTYSLKTLKIWVMFVIFGQRYPKHVHHRWDLIPKNQKHYYKGGTKWQKTKKENSNTIKRAIVAGPDKHVGFKDLRTNYYTKPTLAGNVSLVIALVALSGAKPYGVIDKTLYFLHCLPCSRPHW